MCPAHDEGLPEVVPDTTPQALSRLEAEHKRKYLDGDAPQTVIPKDMDTTKIAVIGAGQRYVVAPDGDAAGSAEGAQLEKRAGARICGLRRKTFWIVFVVAIVIVAAAVGGGIGGGLAANKSKGEESVSGDENGASTTGSSTSTLTSTTTSSSTTRTSSSTSTSTSTSTSSSPTPTFLNNQTTSGNTFAFQAFSDDTFLGKATTVIDNEGGTDLGFNAHSYGLLRHILHQCHEQRNGWVVVQPEEAAGVVGCV